METLGEILADFKKREKDCSENLAPLIDDTILRNGLIAWKSVSIKYVTNKPCEVGSETARWDWMWSCVEFDARNFANVADINMQNVGALLKRLQGLRLIYPDGTINILAKQLLQAQIMAKISGKSKAGRPKKN